MKLQTLTKDGIQEVACNVIADVVSCGGYLFSGIHVIDEDLAEMFVTECAAYAIHEGRVTFDTWYPDEENELGVEMAFCISEASSAELLSLRLLFAKAPPGSVVKTEDGNQFLVLLDGTITDGDLTYNSLAEIGVDFSLKSSIEDVLVNLTINSDHLIAEME